jgi:RNA polymerase sigma-70 factor (ECF subfamily)
VREPFPSTIWTQVRDAAAGRTTATTDFVARYRPAVVSFVRRRGVDMAEAEDVAQEVFLRLFDGEVLERADRARGRFRSLLLSVTRHVLGHHFEKKSALKRGGAVVTLSFAAVEGLRLDECLAKDEHDPEFDREWLANLLEAALGRLRRENAEYHECVRAFLVDERSHREIASALGKTEAMVRNAISRGKARLARLLREEIGLYASCPAEHEDEVRYLSSLLPESRPM